MTTTKESLDVSPSQDFVQDGIRRQARLFDLVQAHGNAMERAQFERSAAEGQLPISIGNPFQLDVIDFSVLDSNGIRKDRIGFGLYYRRAGSLPGGRIQVDINGRIEDMAPGTLLKAPIEFYTVYQCTNNRTPLSGLANLVVLQRPNVTYYEPPLGDLGGAIMKPVDLLGTSATPTFAVKNANTAPSGADANQFDVTGYRVLDVIVDTDASGGHSTTSITVVPWFKDYQSGVWSEMGTNSFAFPDSNPTKQRYRRFTVELEPGSAGKMFFADNNSQATTGYIVRGIA